MRNICVVVTARPSYARIKTALEAIKNHPELDLQLIVAASGIISRYGDVSRVIEADGLDITARALTLVEGESPEAMAKTTGLGIIELSTLFSIYKPDVVITVADRYETMATAIAAAYQNIPLVHVQGGEVTGSIDEKVRHSITKIADFHLVANDEARERVIRMGEHPDRVINLGCPSIDLAKRSLDLPDLDLDDAIRLYGGVGAPIDASKDYIIVMQHPVTMEHAEAREQVEHTIAAVHESCMQAIWFWPNPDAGSDGTSKGIRMFREHNPDNRIHFFKNMEPEMFLNILRRAKCIVGNSSVSIRECAFLGVPAVNIGSRQANRQRGANVLDASHDAAAILAAIRTQIAKKRTLEPDFIYGNGDSGPRFADFVAQMPLVCEKHLTY
jgi:bifunctional UDP-N-acetylglucosamine 2-epimerase / N-acetylmannosamine kinase